MEEDGGEKLMEGEGLRLERRVEIDNGEEVEGGVKKGVVVKGMFDEGREKVLREKML